MKQKQFTVGGLFTNLRGLEIGAERAGFTTVFSSDISSKSAAAFKLLQTNPNEVFITKDIRKLSFKDIADELSNSNQNLEAGELDLLVGGPPCFGMTGLNRYRSVFHKDNMLMFDTLKLIDEIRPKIVILEQVPILLSKGMRPFFNLLKMKLDSMNYNWDVQVLNAAEFGCFQSRKRAIFILTRKDLDVMPSYPQSQPINYEVQSARVVIGAELIRSAKKSRRQKRVPRSGDLVFGTMTSQKMEVFRNDRWEILNIGDRKKLAHMDSVDLTSILCATEYCKMLGNMVLPPFAEALAKHVLNEILIKSGDVNVDIAA